jgi:AcrR family transcriptional regulator
MYAVHLDQHVQRTPLPGHRQSGILAAMPFPAKTDRARILAAAMEQLASDGLEKLSLRSLAASLDLAPTALYRYFPSRSALEVALTAEIAGQVHAKLRRAAGHKLPEPAIRALTKAYVSFSTEQPHLYNAFLQPCAETEQAEEPAHEALWNFVLEQVARITGPKHAPEAAVALWAMLHGFVELKRAGVFHQGKPLTGFDWGMQAWLKAARA